MVMSSYLNLINKIIVLLIVQTISYTSKNSIVQGIHQYTIIAANMYYHHKKLIPFDHQNLRQVIKQIQKQPGILILNNTDNYKLLRYIQSYIHITDSILGCPVYLTSSPYSLQYAMNKVILIEDHCQLPATISNPELIKGMYSRSLFRRFWQSYSQNIQKYLQDIEEHIQLHKKYKYKQYFHILNTQYRLNPLICQFPSANFYSNRLASSQSVINRPRKSQKFNLIVKQVCFIDCIRSKQQKVFNSFVNKIQAQCVVAIVIKIMKNNSQTQSIPESINIGIITPYSEQQNYIRRLLKQKRTLLPVQNIRNINITVSTVDSYQGQQRDIILISTVRANHKGNVGFLTDQRRINVALTRAKYALIVVGHSQTLNSNKIWSRYIGTYMKYQGLQPNSIPQLLNQLFEGNKTERLSSSKNMQNQSEQSYLKNLGNFPLINKTNEQEQEDGMKIVLNPKVRNKRNNEHLQEKEMDKVDIIMVDRKHKQNIFDRINY